MRDIDSLIGSAVEAEERDLLQRIGPEPGYVAQATDLFRGRLGWVNMVLMLTQAAAFIAGVWAAWHFFAATDMLAALKWGLPATVLLLTSLILKMALWPAMQANRVLREVSRLALLRDR